MKNLFIQFIVLLSFIILIAFAIHLIVLNNKGLPVFDNKIILAYSLNYAMAIGIYLLLYTFRIKLKHQLGFLFMGGSLLKFLLFFIFFYTSYKSDGSINSLEFTAFFIPYTLCLIIETYSLVRLLQRLD